MPSLLILGLNIGKHSIGGVSNFNKLLINSFSNKINCDYFEIATSPKWVRNLEKSKIKYAFEHFLSIFRLKKKLSKNEYDYSLSNSSMSIFSLLRDSFFLLIVRNSNIKTNLLIHGWKNKDYEIISTSSLLTRFFSLILSLPDNIFVLSNEFKQKLGDIGVSSSKIRVISTMVNTNDYSKKLSTNSNLNVLFCANPITIQKGINEFILASKIVKKIDKRVVFNIIGESVNKNIIFPDSVKCLGYMKGNNKISNFFNNDVFVLPSYTEGFPTIVLEAMAAGNLIIATKVGGLNDYLKHGIHGFFLSNIPPSPKELALLLIYLSNNQKIVRKISLSNQLFAQKNFSTNVVTKKIEKMILSN